MGIEVRTYVSESGETPFSDWFQQLDVQAAAKVTVALTRMELGNLSNVKSVGGGVSEYRIDCGPGYRIYFGREANLLILLVGGGTKQRQNADIQAAKRRWENYKKRKKKEASHAADS